MLLTPKGRILARVELSFVERKTPDLKASDPVLIMIHGRGDSPENFIHLSDGVPSPRRELALRGFQEQDFGYDRGWRWFESFVGEGDTETLCQEIDLATSIVAKHLKKLNEKEGQTARRFVVSGFSQGGILTYALALKHPELVAHALPIAGLLPPACRPTLQDPKSLPPIDGFHGLADPLVCPKRAQELIAALEAQNYPVTFQGYAGVEHTVSPAMLADYEQALQKALERS